VIPEWVERVFAVIGALAVWVALMAGMWVATVERTKARLRRQQEVARRAANERAGRVHPIRP
jgi:hypothetical protein